MRSVVIRWALAAIACRVLTGSPEGARAGYRIARTELGEAVPPHTADVALAAYRDEGRRLAAAAAPRNSWSTPCGTSRSRP